MRIVRRSGLAQRTIISPPPVKYTLSILICTVPQRTDKLNGIIKTLIGQSIGKPVEVIYLGDNTSITVGEKRNLLMRMAAGDYIIYIDDDDEVVPDFINEILIGCNSGADTVTYNMEQSTDDKFDRKIVFSLDAGKNHRHGSFYLYLPNHTCAIKRELALKVEFENINLSEDHKWAEALREYLKTEYHINKVLYYYKFNRQTSMTRGR